MALEQFIEVVALVATQLLSYTTVPTAASRDTERVVGSAIVAVLSEEPLEKLHCAEAGEARHTPVSNARLSRKNLAHSFCGLPGEVRDMTCPMVR